MKYSNKFLLSALLFLQSIFLFAQISVSGYVVNKKGEQLPYINIGIKGKNIGTCSDLQGLFSLSIPEKFTHDTLTFSMTGYINYTISISDLNVNKKEKFQLKETSYKLKEVIVSSHKLLEKKYGITKSNSAMHFIDASLNKNDIFEIGQRIHLPKSGSKVTSVNLFINESRKDSGTFRLNFYQIADGYPSKILNEKEIIQRKDIKEGWLKFDISNENMYLQGDVVAAIEFIPTKAEGIKYEVKVGGTSKSFVRTSSLGPWQIPPHHYKLYVTALVSDEKNKSFEKDEEKESLPAVQLYSKNIHDTLSLFVALPKEYFNHNEKKYPVVYMLDGNVYFDHFKDDAKAIIVGIGYKNAFVADSLRQRDYTCPKATQADSMSVSGGAAEFLNCIKNELIPYIDKNYRTDTTKRTLMGHSLGGYFTLYALSSEWEGRNSFSKYVAASPSLDYSNDYLLNEFKKLATQKTTEKELFMTVGEEEKLTQFPILVNILKNTSLKIKSDVYPKMDHMETAVITFKKALKKK